jgi:O-antigen/teichoic acid export membrane protein
METESEMNRRFASQLPGNVISNIAYFLVSVVISILLVPYFISTLGVAAYGLIPLAGSITGYVAIVVQSLNITVSRFLTVDLQRNDFVAANRTFNTAFFGLAILIALSMPIVIIVSWFVPVIFNVPAGQETGAIILVLCASIAFFISSLTGTYTVQLFAYNRLDLTNLVNILSILVQVGLIVLLFGIFGPNLMFVGGAYLGAAIATSLIAIILAKRVCPHLCLSLNSFDRSKVKDLWEMGGWVLIGQIGTLLFLQIDLIVVNLLFGATSAGEYAIVLKWSNTLRTIAGVLGGVLTPIILTYYAREHTEKLIRVTKSAVKLMGLAMALPIGLVWGFAPQILTVWVGEQYAFLAPLMVLMTVPLMINLAVTPLFSINTAYNKVRLPGIVTLIMGIANFALAVLLALFSGWGYYGVAAAGAIVLTLKNAVFTPWYATKVIGVGVHTFTSAMFPGLVAGLLLGGIATVLGIYLPLYTLIPLIVTSIVLSLLYSILMWRIGLSISERKLFGSYMPEKIRRFVL